VPPEPSQRRPNVAAPTREYIYAGNVTLAKIESGATTYYHRDHLSNRLVTNSSGAALEQLGTFPFGESWYNASNDKLLFTSYERDPESGNDYAITRTYVNRLGRFASPDPLGGSIEDPQSLDHYSYVRNDPVNSTDPSGMFTLPGGFGLMLLYGGAPIDDSWNEFDVLTIPVGLGSFSY
jgi:RHS repeat-associated protein